MATGTIRSQHDIQLGYITSGTIPAGSYYDFVVTFDHAFNDVPTVVASYYANTNSQENLCIVSRATVTSTGVTFRIENPTSADKVLSSNRKIAWIAVL